MLGLALSELVLTLEVPLAEIVIAFGSGEASTTRLALRFCTPVKIVYLPI